jgi:hypothetical protein
MSISFSLFWGENTYHAGIQLKGVDMLRPGWALRSVARYGEAKNIFKKRGRFITAQISAEELSQLRTC